MWLSDAQRPLDHIAKGRLKDRHSQASGFDALWKPSHLSLNLQKVFMALSEAVARLTAADAP